MNPSRKTLGRGLEHLMSEASKVETPLTVVSNRGFLQLPLDSLPGSGTETVPSIAPADLTNSVQTHGILQPILVRKSETGYEVIDGHQRLLAARALGLGTVPAMVLNTEPSHTAALAAAANRHRLPPPEPPPEPCVAPVVPATTTPRDWRADWRLHASWVTIAGVALLTGSVATLWFTRTYAAADPGNGLATTNSLTSEPLAPQVSTDSSVPQAEATPAWVQTLRIDGVNVASTDGVTTVTFENPVFARYVTMTPPAEQVLRALADALGRIEPSVSVRVLGHTDDTPVHAGSLYRDNYALGLARAVNVVRFLRYNAGLTNTPLAAVSEGDANPPFANNSPGERAKNRTVTMEITTE